jgi:hypothetical protein
MTGAIQTFGQRSHSLLSSRTVGSQLRDAGEYSRMAPEGAENRLNRPEIRFSIEPTFEDKSRVTAATSDDMLPRLWQAVRGLDTEEVAQDRLAESVEMFVRPE